MFAKTFRLAWAAPCSLLGLFAAALIVLLGGKAVISAGVLEVTYRERLQSCGRLAAQLPFRGIVFGHVILAVIRQELLQIGPHERVHVEQYARWGLFFFPAYAVSSAWQLLHGRSAYWHNHFEVQARLLAGKTHRTNGGV